MGNTNIPEAKVCNQLGIIMMDGLGGKIQSSSWLLKASKDEEMKIKQGVVKKEQQKNDIQEETKAQKDSTNGNDPDEHNNKQNQKKEGDNDPDEQNNKQNKKIEGDKKKKKKKKKKKLLD